MNNLSLNSIRRYCVKAKHSLIINLIGLSLGFAVLIAIVFFIREEKNYNQFHENIDNLYCTFTIEPQTNNSTGWHETVPALPKALRIEFPEVQDAALARNGTEDMLIANKNHKSYEKVQLADPNLFYMFSFPIIQGEIPVNSEDTKVIAISQKMATKYFGNENAIGKLLEVDNKYDFTVIAVFDDMPMNSSIRFDFWAPIKLLEEKEPGCLDTWYNLSFRGYVLLKPNASYTEANKKLFGRIQQSNPESKDKAQLYPFSKLYLEAWGHKKNVQTMSLIGVIVLILVCINFINLQTAETFKRIKQFGIKKLNGASHVSIGKQLISEALFQTILAIIIGVTIAHLGKPYLLNLIGKSDSTGNLLSVFSITIILVSALILALLSGLIPALTIKSISPTNSLKDKISDKISVKRLRYIFTAFQFCMAVTLIICLLATDQQLKYLRNKNLGFNKEQLLYISLDGNLYEKRDVLKQSLEKNSNIINASLTSHSPIGIYWNGGGWEWEGKEEGFEPQVTYIETDNNFQETFEVGMAEGDYFKATQAGVVINQTFANMIAPGESAIGKILILESEGIEIPITGVIEDIHFKPLDRKIGALMFIPELGFTNMKYLFVKIAPHEMDKTLAFIQNTITNLNPEFPYEHHFLDDDFARQYIKEETLRNQMTFFSIIAIFISCIGLWGILVFIVNQRIKEIGVRKVNGAKVHQILSMININFLKWISISIVFACPIAWYFMQKWLEKFAYKTTLSWWIFALAGALALGIALITVSWQSWRAATRNPVEALRYE